MAEVCKITYILIMASLMTSYKEKISSVKAVIHISIHLLLLVGMNMVLSGDLGVSLIFVFIFIVMAYTGGVSYFWFIGAIAGLLTKLLIPKKRSNDNRLIILLAMLFIFCGICAMLGVSPLLGCMAMGMTYINLTDDDKLFRQLNYFSPRYT